MIQHIRQNTLNQFCPFSTPINSIYWGGDFPEEAQPFFSPAFLWTRPQETAVVETQVFAAFKDYLKTYLDFVEQAEAVTDSQNLVAIEQAQLRYLRYRAEKRPSTRDV